MLRYCAATATVVLYFAFMWGLLHWAAAGLRLITGDTP